MDNNKEYILILIDSLKKKTEILNQIKEANEEQKNIAMADEFDDDAFEKNIEEKEKLISKLMELDNGFETVYERVKEEISANSSSYTDEIAALKELISVITGKSMDIQAQEKRNNELLMKTFERIHQKVHTTKNSKKVAENYYQTMAKSTYIEPQFLDKKK